MIEPLQELLAADAIGDLGTRPIEELRAIRVRCTEVEADVSLARRVAQGRLDIVGHEVQRRAGASDAALGDLLFELPDILSDGAVHAGAPSGRPVEVNAPGPVALELVRRLDGHASPSELGGVAELDDAALRELFERVGSAEVELSAIRRRLHERIDTIQSEIGRRYRDGETSIESFMA